VDSQSVLADIFIDMVDSIWSYSRNTPPKQPFWDRPGILADHVMVQSSLSLPSQQACSLAASALHSGHWLFAMLITSCGLRLDDEAVRVGLVLRLVSGAAPVPVWTIS